MTVTPHQPVWQPSKPSVFGNRYFRFSPKLGAFVNSASRLQHEGGYLHDWNKAVTKFISEPGYATAYIENRWRRSRFDFWVEFEGGEQRYEEIKYTQDLGHGARAHRQIAIQKAWCAERGIAHAVVTDRDIWANPVLINSLTTLFSEYDETYYLRKNAAMELFPTALSYIDKIGAPRICDVIGAMRRDASVECARLCVFELIRLRHVCADLEHVRLSPISVLKIRNEAYNR